MFILFFCKLIVSRQAAKFTPGHKASFDAAYVF